MEEIWKPIEGYEGLYEVSSYGRIKSLERYRSNNGGIQLIKERIMKPLDYNGYKNVVLWKNGSKKKEYVHRLVAKAFLPNPDNLKEVNHRDENPSNNMVENIEWCDHQYNMIYGTARERARVISEQLPQYRTYISYESPYWRLKVGDFISSDAAEQAASELKQLFPQYGRELRVVKDRINIQK